MPGLQEVVKEEVCKVSNVRNIAIRHGSDISIVNGKVLMVFLDEATQSEVYIELIAEGVPAEAMRDDDEVLVGTEYESFKGTLNPILIEHSYFYPNAA